MRILISGATGFLGKHLIDYFSQQKENQILGITSKPIVLPFNIKNQFNLINWNLMSGPDIRTQRIIKEFDANLIIHAAAISSNQECGNNWTKNGIITQNFLDHLYNKPDFIYISSADVYDKNGNINPTNMYGLSKLIGEKLCHQWYQKHVLQKLIILRPAAFTGKYATHGLVKDIVTKLRLNEPTLKLLGSYPGTCKPILHVEDIINIAILSLNHSIDLTTLSITSDPIYVNEVACIIMDELKIQKNIEYDENNWNNDNNIWQSVNLDLFLHVHRSSKEAVKLAAKQIYRELIK